MFWGLMSPQAAPKMPPPVYIKKTKNNEVFEISWLQIFPSVPQHPAGSSTPDILLLRTDRVVFGLRLAARLQPVIPESAANCACLERLPQLRREANHTRLSVFRAGKPVTKQRLDAPVESKYDIVKGAHPNLPAAA